ncbi:MAG: serine/threonine protein kinase [Gammaproteobacteria bacterium]
MDNAPNAHDGKIEVPGFQIQTLIAEGRTASIHLAIQESLGRRVVLKVLKRIPDHSHARRALNEGWIIASLNHRNVITIHDIGTVEGRHYIAMEYLEGGDLATRTQDGTLGEERALDIADKIGECLAFVHRQGIIHRDLKPENVLFHKDGEPILTDFGIAKALDTDITTTVDGSMIGTLHYFSPEQATGKPVDRRTDIYGLGIIFFEMLTGKKPYGGESKLQVILAHAHEPIPRLPPHLGRYQELLERMIAKDRQDRFSTAEELVDNLRKIRSGGSQDSIAPLSAIDTPEVAAAADILAQTKRLVSTGAQALRRYVDRLAPERVARAAGRVVRALTRIVAEDSKNRFTTAGVSGVFAQARHVVATRAQALWRGAKKLEPQPLVGVVRRSVHVFSFANPHVRMTAIGFTVVLLAVLLSSPANEDHDGVRPDQVSNAPQSKVDSLTAGTRPDKALEPQVTDASALQARRQIDEYLLSAEQASEEYRLTTPKSDNAYSKYLAVLSLDPGNEQALEGLVAIADRYANLAESEIRRLRYRKARLYVARGLSVQPDNNRLLALQRRVNEPGGLGRRISAKFKSLFR